MSLSNTHSNVCQCSSNYNNTDSCYVNLRFAGSNMAMSWVGFGSFYLLLAGLIIGALRSCNGGISSSSYSRSSGISDDMPLNSDVFALPPGYNSPQQVHITQGDNEGRGVIVSWVTPNEPGSIVTYKYYNYSSPYIHHCTIKNLEYNTKCFYEVGTGDATRRFWFTTPPEVGPDVPYTFGLIGDLGQTFDSNRTLTHYESNPIKGQTVLFVGDLSYADKYPLHDKNRWDTWGRFVERNVAYQPWIWNARNHEIDFLPEYGEGEPFKPYTHRYFVPYEASGTTSPLWYSIKRASAYIIVLSSYSAYGKSTPQYKWLMKELPKVNRSKTPWLIVVMHCPLYSTYVHRYMEGETMRVMYEQYFVQYKVDVVFAGHVHAYERTVSNFSIGVFIVRIRIICFIRIQFGFQLNKQVTFFYSF
ncbi:putative phosphoric monoester hydrolase [Helianthus annuus]|uniref:Purple acid phosphatase n=1 Tax=Helianthus annuus TaxID=4232 RepID=A0A9K3JN22_HELAN|nr:putative phosphoric monoester hydrolase [Helianthus annuus]KAJ0951465.1 putative phosphoric monoester hydrolase [Helianthus annuus]